MQATVAPTAATLESVMRIVLSMAIACFIVVLDRATNAAGVESVDC